LDAGGDKAKAAEEVEKMIAVVLEMDDHRWLTGNEPEAVKKARLKALEELRSDTPTEVAGIQWAADVQRLSQKYVAQGN